MTLKWPASKLLATSFSMVGTGRNPVLGIGVGAEMGYQPACMWRGLRQIGSARKELGGTGSASIKHTKDRYIHAVESARAARLQNRPSIPLRDAEAGQLSLFVKVRNSPGCVSSDHLRSRGTEFGASRSGKSHFDGTAWSPKRHSRCLHAACTHKDPVSYSRGRRKMWSSSPCVTLINNIQNPGGQNLCITDSRFITLTSSPLYTYLGRATWRFIPASGTGASGQRKLSYFKSENLRWRKSYFRFKVFSEDVDSREAASRDLNIEESVEIKLRDEIQEFEGTGGGALNRLAESAVEGVVVQESEVSLSSEEEFVKADTEHDKGHLDAGPLTVSPADVTVICFDIETTGLHPAYHRIIEFAARDLAGGEYSTIQTLVNPGREVPLESERIHKISSKMVNNPEVPRWRDVALAIVRFVDSRRKGQGPVILVAHNGRRFDVPFIMKEFRDCDVPVPSYWRFADSMPLARSAMKSLGQKRPKVALTDLFCHYNLQYVGDAHRAMADVNMLAPVLQMIMNDLSMGVQELLEESFSAEDLLDKGKALPVNDVPAVEEIYDGIDIDAVSSQVVVTGSLEADSQLYEAALGIQTSDEVAGIPRGPSVPWDSSSENPYMQTEDEFEKSLGLSLGCVQEISLNQPIIEMQEEHPVDVTTELKGFLERHDDTVPSEREPLPSASSADGRSTVEKRYESDPLATSEEMSLPEQGGRDIQTVDSRKGHRVQAVDISLNQIEVISEDSSEYHISSNGSVKNNDEMVDSRDISEEDVPLRTSTVDISLLSPMMRQYVETKRQRDPKFLLLSQVGDFYEAFFEDAERLADACNLRLTAKDGGKLLRRKIPMAGVPVQHIEKNLQMLLRKGIPVVRQEQVGEEDNGVAIERRVTAVLTPGTLVDNSMLEESFNNFLVAIMPPSSGEDGTWGLAFSDISTGEFQATELHGREAFVQELLRLQPAEILFPVSSTGQIHVDTPTPVGLPSQFCYSSRPLSEFSKAETEKKLQLHYGAIPLETMGIASFPRALRAAGGLLGYVQETQQMASEDLPLQRLKYYSASDSMLLSETVRKHLEITATSRWGKAEGSFVWAVDDTKTAMGRRMLQKWLLRPLLQHQKINERQEAVEAFIKHSEVRKALRSELELLGDLERLTGKVGWRRASARDMLTVAQTLQALPKLAEIVEGISLNPYITAVMKIPFAAIQMADRIQGMLVEESGARFPGELIRGGIDITLDQHRNDVEQVHNLIARYEKEEQDRTGIASLEVGFAKPHGRFISIRKTKLKDWNLPEDYQGIQSLKTEERFTTPVLQEYERLRLDAVKKATEREEELFSMLKDEMSSLLEPVQEYSKALAEIDVICNFAEIADKYGYCRPQIVDAGREVTIVKGRHPVVERCLSGRPFVSNSTYLGYTGERKGCSNLTVLSSELQEACKEGYEVQDADENGTHNLTIGEDESSWPRPDVMILTGPNASGKSCYLRQIGLIQILSQAGSFVPAQECRLSLADGVYTRVGSVDDLAAGQSTFKVEMSETAAILAKATPQSLVLLDEVGRGTGSQEGEMIARALIEYLARQVKARTVFSTHYHQLHDLDLELENVSNYHLEAVETPSGDVVFDHTVRPGYALRSYAVGVARASGMPQWVCNRAIELLADVANASGREDKMTGPPALDDLAVETHITDELGEKHLMQRDIEDENQSGGSCMGDTISNETDDTQRGTPKVNRHMADSNTGEVDSSYLEEREGSAVSELGGTQPEQQGYEERKLPGDSTSESKENSSDLEANVAPAEVNWVGDLPDDDLTDLWNRVCGALQNRPATQALTKQKGNLISITRSSDTSRVRMGASALFVKKFQQHEHASALEAAFAAVLKQPVKLDVSILDTNDKKH
ncbi:hypothetical protein R1sor_013265 [Riccia sorocarpa]|uniref:DNA mismatch repair proteins mutS family domain-containing protein n=1 Tax=Riccia sorocarpa TaxID=122646 RepID=A0ABD3H814_9MARC